MPLGLKHIGKKVWMYSISPDWDYQYEYDTSPLRFWETAGPEYWQRDAKGTLRLQQAIPYEHPETVLALLKNMPPAPNQVLHYEEMANALRECLDEGDHMNECIEELVINLGADVSVCLDGIPTAIDTAVINENEYPVMELLVLMGTGMDFDRFQPFLCTEDTKEFSFDWMDHTYKGFNRCANPLEKLVYEFEPSFTEGTEGDLYNEYWEWNKKVCILFVQMGATRRRECLEWILLRELRRKNTEKRQMFLKTLIDAFAYLPKRSALEQRLPTHPILTSVQHPFHRISEVLDPLYQIDVSIIWDTEFSLFEAADDEYVQRLHDYDRRQAEVPSLLHLSRCAIRSHMGANVRDVLKKPNIPKTVKRYILLGYDLDLSKHKGMFS